MATRRPNKVEINVPIPPRAAETIKSTADKLDSPRGSPFLPTILEASLLAIYPATLLLGSLFSILHPASRNATYVASSQSYDPLDAPSYFAKKSNIFNVYFVKVGWFWTTLAFFVLIFTHSSHGPAFRVQFTKRRVQAIARYVVITTIWVFMTQWFFGPGIVDRSFRWTGGKCDRVLATDLADKLEEGDAKDVFTHAACKAIGGQWRGGHDISGHVFLLILGSTMLWMELLPAVLHSEGLREKRRIRTADGLTRNASMETDARPGDAAGQRELGFGIKAALGVAGLSWWMLLMTAAFFHTWFEKVTGLLVAFSAIYTVYFLPRGLPALRQALGLPGV
ncbi:Putative Fat storage-inducing transmembrane protein [Septoria linicola]|uniref:Acyl-coenzyme A diphosphatase SCS3 n=1 Tax=Septoria linicola TaxID=215465 RepID=A0A9Q9AII0_9PEZI|nr:putative Fat storage-inducing transmembrane protein [Septoria linicola]USW46813.1 Putative Fat storage-inducing transmembrane protein [Septoria linicola]